MDKCYISIKSENCGILNTFNSSEPVWDWFDSEGLRCVVIQFPLEAESLQFGLPSMLGFPCDKLMSAKRKKIQFDY